MAFAKVMSRGMAAFGLVALVACQTTPQDEASMIEQPDTAQQAPDAGLTPTEPSSSSTAQSEALEQDVEYSPLMVFLADFEPQTDWVEVVLDEERTLYLQPDPSFTRDDLLSVETYSSESGEGLLALMLTEPATERLKNLTTQNPDRRLALAVDGTLLSVPRYSEPLLDGQLVFMVGSVQNAETAARIIAGEDATPYGAEQ